MTSEGSDPPAAPEIVDPCADEHGGPIDDRVIPIDERPVWLFRVRKDQESRGAVDFYSTKRAFEELGEGEELRQPVTRNTRHRANAPSFRDTLEKASKLAFRLGTSRMGEWVARVEVDAIGPARVELWGEEDYIVFADPDRIAQAEREPRVRVEEEPNPRTTKSSM